LVVFGRAVVIDANVFGQSSSPVLDICKLSFRRKVNKGNQAKEKNEPYLK
jgi:hypothetical protein